MAAPASTPCTITFDASNTGPDTVPVRTHEDKKGTLTESDNCGGASGVATVTRGSGDDWTVTAGPTHGHVYRNLRLQQQAR